MADEFKPPLWKRVLNESIGAVSQIQEGGGDVKDTLSNMKQSTKDFYTTVSQSFNAGFMKRVIVRMFILNISMYVAMTVMKIFSVDKLIIVMGSNEKEFKDQSFGSRYGKILLIYIVFVILSALFNWVLTYGLYYCITSYFTANAPTGVKIPEYVENKWQLLWNKFETLDGFQSMSIFGVLYIIAMGGLLLYFMAYTFFANSFITRMDYPDYLYDESTSDNEEGTREYDVIRKFLTHQQLFITYFLLIASSLVIADSTKGSIFHHMFSLTLVFVMGVYAMFVSFMLRLDVNRKMTWMLINLALLFIYVITVFNVNPFTAATISVFSLIYIVVIIGLMKL